MFKNAISLVVATILSMVAATGWSQTISIPTNSMDGWSINNESMNNGALKFHINTWSTEGDSDGSGMTKPFLENWVASGNTLPAGIWSYTVSGLTPKGIYQFSALVRAYNESSYTYPTDVCLYAGDCFSEDISTGTQFFYKGNNSNSSGYYKTLSVYGVADDNGQLQVGVNIEAGKTNWVAMKNATLTYTGKLASQSTFMRVNGKSEISDGAKILIVYQTNESDKAGVALDGNQPSIASLDVTISNDQIDTDESHSFVVTKSGNYYIAKGVGNNKYLYPQASTNIYSNYSTQLDFEASDKGFYIKRNPLILTYYLNYSSKNVFEGSTKSKKVFYFYRKVSLSFPQPHYQATMSSGFTAPTLNKVPSDLSVTYRSSNPSVATVNASTGAVSLVAKGTTIVTATYGSVSASYILEVVDNRTSPGLSFWHGSTLELGNTYQTGYSRNGSGRVTYISSDPTIASISSTGLVTGVSPGVATMTATVAANGQYLSESKSIEVTVVKKDPYLWMNINPSTIDEGQTTNVNSGHNGDGEVSYYSTDSSIATVDKQGKVTGKGDGTAYIVAYLSETSTYRSTIDSVLVTVKGSKTSPNLQFATVDNALTVYVGETLATTESHVGDGELTYTSSQSAIATIDANGVIRGVTEGSVTLTATVAETPHYKGESKSITIEVSLKDPQLSFATENGSAQIAVGDQLKTKASSLSEATIVYTSSNTGVATIDNKGVITGEGVGTATLTATVAAEGSYKGATKSLVVTVGKRSANVVPSFTSKTVRVGGTAVLKLITESNGNQHFVSDNTAIATINATTGEITGIAEGTATIRYWVDASAGYAASDEGLVTVTVSNKLEPIVEVNPGSVSLAIGGRKEITVDLGDYTGDCSAVSNNDQIASVVQKSHDAENHLYVFSVNGIKSGETFLTLSLTETNNHTAKEIKVPITVLNIYQYELTVVNAPANGVAIQIWGVTYTDNTIFNSSHSSIIETDVNVRYLPSYSSAVSISGRNITVTYSLKEATKGTFLRLKNYNCGKYATLSADGSALDMTEKGMDNIIYYDEQGHFLFYRNGQFVKSVNKMASVAEASEADVFTFTRGTGDYSECFSIKSGSQYLLGSASGTSVGTTEGSEYAYWHLEMLESLPVMVSANGYGYASLYSPVELEVSGGLSAYYIDSKTDSHDDSHNGVIEYNLHLEQLMSVIPANTPVILVGVQGTTYNCPIKYESTQSAPVSADALTGHYAAQVSADVRGTGTIYALQASKSEETVGFYPWTKETMSGFKCYFVETNASPAPYYRLVFGAETSLKESLIETIEDSAAFNLHGQRVGDSRKNLPSGLYIVRGKKIIVK